jgi:hypothetical protein
MQAEAGETTSLDSLTTTVLKAQILLPTTQLQGTCVFYTSVETPEDIAARILLGGYNLHNGLSKIATDWACANNKISIWVTTLKLHCILL